MRRRKREKPESQKLTPVKKRNLQLLTIFLKGFHQNFVLLRFYHLVSKHMLLFHFTVQLLAQEKYRSSANLSCFLELFSAGTFSRTFWSRITLCEKYCLKGRSLQSYPQRRDLHTSPEPDVGSIILSSVCFFHASHIPLSFLRSFLYKG